MIWLLWSPTKKKKDVEDYPERKKQYSIIFIIMIIIKENKWIKKYDIIRESFFNFFFFRENFLKSPGRNTSCPGGTHINITRLGYLPVVGSLQGLQVQNPLSSGASQSRVACLRGLYYTVCFLYRELWIIFTRPLLNCAIFPSK